MSPVRRPARRPAPPSVSPPRRFRAPPGSESPPATPRGWRLSALAPLSSDPIQDAVTPHTRPASSCRLPPGRPNTCSIDLASALQRNCVSEVRRALRENEMAVHTLVRGTACLPPLLAAVRRGCSGQILRLLLEEGAAVDEADFTGITPLLAVASAPPMLEPCDEFLWKAPSELPWLEVHSPKATAMTEERCCSHAALLLASGANPDIADGQGLTAAQLAEAAGRYRLAELIQHWTGVQACKVLRAHWSRAAADAASSAPSLLELPPGVDAFICACLEPRRG